MQVILLEKISNLGNLGAKVDVKPGYGRNFLIPQKKAVLATPNNIAKFEAQRADLEKKAQEMLTKAQQRASKLNDVVLVLRAQASDEGKLYGSIGVSEIQAAMSEQDIEVSKREIVLSEGVFHSVGQYSVEVHVHMDVIARVALEIVSAK